MKLEDIYKTIADLIDSSQVRGLDIVFYVDKMAVDLENSEIPSDDIERLRLESQIETTSNLLAQRHNVYTIQLLKLVEALQRYVDDNFISVNSFLSSNDIQVKSVFADISNEVGYLIDSSNIEGIS